MSKDQTGNLLPDIGAVDAIRAASAMYVGDYVTGALLSARLVETLILLDAAPLRVARLGEWHSVYADKDWFAPDDAALSFDAFYRLIPLPKGGRFYDRAEVILTALADAVVTVGAEGATWISGEPARGQPPDEICLSLPHGRGRLLVFRYSRPDFGREATSTA